jgi:hypothetical protein
VLADFDERAGRHRAATTELAEAIHLAETAGMPASSALYSRLAWSQLQEGQISRAEVMIQRPRRRPAPAQPHILFWPTLRGSPPSPVRRNQDAVDHATESLRIHATGGKPCPQPDRPRLRDRLGARRVLLRAGRRAIDGGARRRGQLLGARHCFGSRSAHRSPRSTGATSEGASSGGRVRWDPTFAAAYQDGRRRP